MSLPGAPNVDRFLAALHRRAVVLRAAERAGLGLAAGRRSGSG
jgi:hypothetical protein